MLSGELLCPRCNRNNFSSLALVVIKALNLALGLPLFHFAGMSFTHQITLSYRIHYIIAVAVVHFVCLFLSFFFSFHFMKMLCIKFIAQKIKTTTTNNEYIKHTRTTDTKYEVRQHNEWKCHWKHKKARKQK